MSDEAMMTHADRSSAVDAPPVCLNLHVGLTKTGTSTLQATVFSGHGGIHYLGKILDRDPRPTFCSREVESILTPLLWGHARPVDVSHLREQVQDHIAGVAGGKVILGSWEGLGSHSNPRFCRMLERTLTVFDRCRVVFTLRNPLTRALSSYLQALKLNYISGHGTIPQGRAYIDFDDWLFRDMKGRAKHPLFEYGDNVRSAVELLGRENVGVFLLEQLATDPAGYCAALCDFLEIDSAEALRLLGTERRKPAMTMRDLEMLRRTDDSTVRRLLWRLTPRDSRKARFREPQLSEGEPDRVTLELSDRQERYLRAGTADANRWIASRFGLDLEKYGYPL